MEDNLKLDDYVDILEIFINHRNDKNPLTPKQLRIDFQMDKEKPKSKPYEQKKRSLDRCLEFYSSIRLISILTDTTLNEIGRLENIRKDRYKPLDDRKQLDSYITFIKEKRRKHTTKIDCEKYNLVKRFRKDVVVLIDTDGDEWDLSTIGSLPKPFDSYDEDENGYRHITKSFKVKKHTKRKLLYEFFGDKFKNITTDMYIDFKDENNDIKNLSDFITIDGKPYTVVDIDDNTVLAKDTLYRLTSDCDYEKNNPIEFKLPSKENFDLFIRFLIQNVKRIGDEYKEDITDPLITKIINSDVFGEYKGFVSQTIGKLIVFNHNNMNTNNKTEGYYPLDVLIQIIESGNSVDVEFENFGNTLKLQNTKIKKIVVSENSFDLHFENFVSQNHTDISQIKKIDNHSEDGLRSDVDKVIKLIDGLDNRDKEYFEKEFDDLIKSFDMMVF